MNWEKIKTGLWGAIGGAIALAIVGFAWGGWETGGAAKEMAGKAAEDAVVARLAPICVEQFSQGSEKDLKLKELKEKAYYERGDYVEEQGWATMLGEKEPDGKVAEKCADILMQLGQ